jgi:hypothetical protein
MKGVPNVKVLSYTKITWTFSPMMLQVHGVTPKFLCAHSVWAFFMLMCVILQELFETTPPFLTKYTIIFTIIVKINDVVKIQLHIIVVFI